MRTFLQLTCFLMFVAGFSFAQELPMHYWTPRVVVETVGVTALHAADAAQTCYHEREGTHEVAFGMPHNCPGAAVYLMSIGPILQYGSYRMARKFTWWKPMDRKLPYIQMGFSLSAIRCSSSKAGCNQWGY
jgi:hypothetical protein